MRMTGVCGTRLQRRSRALLRALIFLVCGLMGADGRCSEQAQAQMEVKPQRGSSAAGSGANGIPEGTGVGVPLDRVVVVVNGEVILESDVDEELRMAAFQPLRDASRNSSREQVIERLINRTLILQQARLEFDEPISDQQVEEQLAELRKAIPACKEYHCETDAGWQKFVADQGFTMEEFTKLWRERMEVLRFIEARFRAGIEITPDEIREYYEKTLLPQYVSEHATAPKLETISSQIQEILLQQQVTSLLQDWLKSLRAQGTVRTIQPDEGTP
jgi:peptidyl-prolyl cis-trans isomerase SurA